MDPWIFRNQMRFSPDDIQPPNSSNRMQRSFNVVKGWK